MYYTDPAQAAIQLSADSCKTRYPRDLAMQAIIIRGAPDRDFAISEILRARAEWETWLTIQQRKWQASISRRPARGRHHDSWDIREKYVRAGGAG